MKISIVTVFPELYDSFINTSLIKRAKERGVVDFDVRSYSSFCDPKERIDSPTFGHGAGMLIKPEVVERAVEGLEGGHGPAFKIFFSPKGQKLDQRLMEKVAEHLKAKDHVMMFSSRYEGMDARVEEHYADLVISVGDFVLMGGDLPAMMLLEGSLRYIPDVVGKQESVERDSFTGALVEHPEYTAPVVWKGMQVPEIVRSGNHAAIRAWQDEQAAEETVLEHFEWLREHCCNGECRGLAEKFIPHHYAALMHTDVVIGDGMSVGTTSVTSIDIHDIARSARTYGLKNFFIVTPLLDQQRIVTTLLDFWKDGEGVEYNPSRHKAVREVELVSSIDETIAAIEKKEGVKPILVGTSAREVPNVKNITYHDQSVVWCHKLPVLLLFGTGQGLSDQLLQRCDFVLKPVEGITDFNHLSVRSAAGIVFDRWLGLNSRT